MPRRALLAIALAGLLAPAASAAEPLAVTNQTPLTRLIGIPAARPVRPGSGASLEVLADWSSHATVSTQGDEAIALDGESLVVALRGDLHRGPWRLSAALPFVHQYGGFLDSWIDEYHQLFGFPEGDRPILGHDQLLYRYLRHGDVLLDRDRGSNGIGDLRVGVQRTLIARDDLGVAAHLQLKLPTGDSERLLGSGGTDLAAGVAAERPLSLAGRRAALYGGAGLVFSERGDVLPMLRERTIGFAHLGLAVPWTPTVTLNAQFDMHTRPYDSELTELRNALQLSVGVAWRATPDWRLSFALNEDVSVHGSPDVTFQFGVRRTRGAAARHRR